VEGVLGGVSIVESRKIWMLGGRGGGRTNREVAETALSSEVFALGLSCEVVTKRKFVRFVGSAVQIDALAIAIDSIVENFIVKDM
jgi:hypothetical protein